MFIEPRTRPFELTAERVLALRPSLNTPVVAAVDLPVGPACAAILVHSEPGHGLQISVGVRSLGCGSVTVFGFDSPIGATLVNVALDSALSFAESMGFLFDDDMVDDDVASQQKAVLRWQEMIGEVPSGTSADRSRAAPLDLFDSDAGELTDPPEPLELEPRPPIVQRELAPESGAPEREKALALTKFRPAPRAQVEGSAGQSEAVAEQVAREAVAEQVAREAVAEQVAREASRRALGRMRLVKRRGKQQAQDVRRAWLLRLLTSF